MDLRHHPGRGRIARSAAAAAAGVLGAALGAAAPAAAADADIRIIGGNAQASVVCGNVAAAVRFARQRGLAVQHNRCTAGSAGGSVVLQSVEIFVVSAAARAANRDNPVLAALAGAAAPAATRAADNCNSYRTFAQRKQLNHCWSDGFAGRTVLERVVQVYKDGTGKLARRPLGSLTVGTSTPGSAAADCRNLVTDPLNQRDDCGSSGAGSGWRLTGVDVRVRNADGSTTLRKGITVEVRGGTASNTIHCFNSTDGSGKVIQVNVCNARSTGGNVTLRDVAIHTYAS